MPHGKSTVMATTFQAVSPRTTAWATRAADTHQDLNNGLAATRTVFEVAEEASQTLRRLVALPGVNLPSPLATDSSSLADVRKYCASLGLTWTHLDPEKDHWSHDSKDQKAK
ncbi:hypothetical protein SNOG_13544 [Parastagonospora nodorum SN15]|uniref:Uncharacterized protein n=1 Tax=Phaeosphaeria nodorum (strain SN15 / ATCC MYA-4574 / FGSC 10173) TaxID=321614 RepID=Q0U3X0_PHANO|nr:hypothetical protein SNOG_13544 [Parastagonospora nodorum SN15]EAT78991.1 hypothetical protein SNOG_13544 [Parastagonospora nodorum SN15]